MDQRFQLLPDQASTFAPRVDLLYLFLWSVTAFFTLLIFLLIVYLGLRYRRRSATEVPTPMHGGTALEIAWTVIPLIIVMVIFFWGAKIYFTFYSPPADAIEIHVIGKQWMWKIQHPEGRREINELHVPVGKAVKLVLSSQDVIHSFYVPAFRVKQDAVPGRYTVMWFKATRVGEYHLFCAEYCGTEHSRMVGKVIVMEPDAYQAWLVGSPADQSPVVAGEKLFKTLGCVACHAVQAPTMAGLYMSQQKFTDGSTVVADDNYLRESILDSTAKIVEGYQPVMPSYRNQISEEQVMQLVSYIKSLKNPPREGGSTQFPAAPAPSQR